MPKLRGQRNYLQLAINGVGSEARAAGALTNGLPAKARVNFRSELATEPTNRPTRLTKARVIARTWVVAADRGGGILNRGGGSPTLIWRAGLSWCRRRPGWSGQGDAPGHFRPSLAAKPAARRRAEFLAALPRPGEQSVPLLNDDGRLDR